MSQKSGAIVATVVGLVVLSIVIIGVFWLLNDQQSTTEIKISENHFGVIQVDLDGVGQRWALVRGIPSFEGELSPSVLYIIDAQNKDLTTVDSVSGAILLDNKTALISKYFSVEPRESSIGDLVYNEEREKLISEITRELGVADTEIRSRIYLIGGKPSAAVNALFEVDLETGRQTFLQLFGGQGGIFRMEDNQIYISNNHTSSSYKAGVQPDQGGLFGTAPYAKYDLISKTLAVTGLIDGFQAGKVARPVLYFVSQNNQVIGGVSGASIITRDGVLYVTFR